MTSIWTRAAVAAVAAAALTACTSSTGADVESKSEADATAAVQQHADRIAGVLGSPLLNPSTNPGPCSGQRGETGRDIFAVQGAYQVTMPVEKHTGTLARLRDLWKADGYTITDDRSFGDGAGVLAARSPEGYSVNVESTSPPSALALLVHSPCFRSPTPR
jgi:hypothetical protein